MTDLEMVRDYVDHRTANVLLDFDSKRVTYQKDVLAALDRIEKRERRAVDALSRIRDWSGFRHTGEVRDLAARVLELNRESPSDGAT